MPLGLAGWFLCVLFAWALAPGWFVAAPVLVVPGAALLIGIGAHLARATAGPGSRFAAIAAVAGALAGALAGAFVATGLMTPVLGVLGAALGANFAVEFRGRRDRVEITEAAATGSPMGLGA